MKIKFTLLILLIVPHFCYAQTVTQIKEDNETYIYGEGKATSIQKADSYALAEVIRQISITIKNEMIYEENTVTTDEDSAFESNFESVIKTYSSATLTNTNRIILENEPDAHVFRYIKRSDIDRIFEARKFKIETMLEEAQEALNEIRINDALRYYYWAHALLKSLRYPNEVFVYNEKGNKLVANVWIPSQINRILNNLKITTNKVSGNRIYFNILYNNEKVNSIDFSIFDGREWGNIYGCKDGIGVAEISDSETLDYIQFKIEHVFFSESVVDPEINEILELAEVVNYKNATIQLNNEELTAPTLDETKTAGVMENNNKTESNALIEDNSADSIYPNLIQLDNAAEFQTIIDTVVDAIITKERSTISKFFTQDGLNSYESLIERGVAQIVDSSSPQYYSLGDKTYCRNILMNFSFPLNNRVFTESVVFEFDENKKISHITLGLSRRAVDEVFSQESWPEAARIILVHFLEGYKSAYSLKQIDYVESVFAEDALIITGSYVKRATAAEMATIGNRYVKLTQQSKSEYIKRLKLVFKMNDYININFADTEIQKAGVGGEIYGIQLKQEYFSTNYGDTGYLFLVVDLNDIAKPIIHVRTWQPEKDPDFGTYSLSDF